MTGFLEHCVNKEAPERFKEYVAYNVASHWDGAPSDQVFGRLVEYLADNPSNHGPLAPPPLDVRFAFVHSCDGLSGFAYSTITGTDLDIDLDLAMKRIPGYVTPALRTAPDHLNFPYSHISGPWEFKDFPGNLTLTVANSRQTVVDSWYNEVENRSEVMTHEALALNLLHKAVEELRIELQMHGTDHQFFCPRRWETVRLYEGCLDEGGTLECTTKLRVDVEGLCNWSKIMTAFGKHHIALLVPLPHIHD